MTMSVNGMAVPTTTPPMAQAANATAKTTVSHGVAATMLQVAEVAERDPERRGGGPRRRRPEADQLGLALPAVPAVAERVVVTAGVRHELTHAGWKRAQVAKRRGHAPVRSRS